MRPFALKHRLAHLYLECGQLLVERGATVLADKQGKQALPLGRLACLFLGPGITVTHEFIKYCAEYRVMLIWVGMDMGRVYSAGYTLNMPENLLHQAELSLDAKKRLLVVRRIYTLMFDEAPPATFSVNELRGHEGAKVACIYRDEAARWEVCWKGRQTGAGADAINRAISIGNAFLYGITEAAVLALGYSPSIGYIHNNNVRGFVFDIADTVKYQTIIPCAFEVISKQDGKSDASVLKIAKQRFRVLLRDNLINRLISNIQKVMA